MAEHVHITAAQNGVNLPPKPSATVVAFPPSAQDVAAVAQDIEQLATGRLLETAQVLLGLAVARQLDPGAATANQHAVFGSMLALCRLLDAAGYPWDFARGARA